MSEQFLPELNTPKGQGKLNGFLGRSSYINGYTPSQEDVKVYKALEVKDISNKYAHLKRWYNHINSFSKEEQSKFGQPENFAQPVVAKKEEKKKLPRMSVMILTSFLVMMRKLKKIKKN